jgi:hypothetical protein
MIARFSLAAALASLVVALSPSLASAATANTQTVSSEGVTATLTYTIANYTPVANQLTISRHGKIVYSQPVTASECGSDCNAFSRTKSLHIVSLDPAAGRQVVLDLYSGGAHCCQIEQVFSYSHGAYHRAQFNFGDPGERLVKMAGKLLFETADDRFAYEFTDYAASGMPIEYIQFKGGRFLNVTRKFPRLIAKDAAFWLKTYKQQSTNKWDDSVGLIAAWAADEDELGNSATVDAYLAQEAQAGHLNSPIEPGGAKFIRSLQKFLKKTGYLS